MQVSSTTLYRGDFLFAPSGRVSESGSQGNNHPTKKVALRHSESDITFSELPPALRTF